LLGKSLEQRGGLQGEYRRWSCRQAFDVTHRRILSVTPIRWEDNPCSQCASTAVAELFRSRDYRFLTDTSEFRIVRCRRCSLVRMNPRPVEADIHRYYHDDFYRAQETPDDALRNMDARLRAMAQHVCRYPTGRLLDVGCFRGEFMEHLRSRHGWDVAGIEFSQRPPNFYGLDIFYGDIAAAPYEDASFDVVTIWAVLEHVYHPAQTLAHVGRLLKPGGTVIILVPNFNSLPARFMHHDDIPRHITMFTRRTLGRMLRSAGLRPSDWACGQDIYGGSVRGWMNFLVKRLHGEPMAEIQAQNRIEGGSRWSEFDGEINGRPSPLLRRISALDDRIAPRLDRVLDRLGLGFMMTVHARKSAAAAATPARRAVRSPAAA
jgi:SAM-dependent methyltransferase